MDSGVAAAEADGREGSDMKARLLEARPNRESLRREVRWIEDSTAALIGLGQILYWRGSRSKQAGA